MPGMENHAQLDGARYALTDYAELVHPEGAKVLAAYEEDFYAGMPALTVNERGRGKAYYVAGRFEAAFLDALYGKILADAGVPGARAAAGSRSPPARTARRTTPSP